MRDFLTSQSSIDFNFKGYYDLEYDQIWFGIAEPEIVLMELNLLINV